MTMRRIQYGRDRPAPSGVFIGESAAGCNPRAGCLNGPTAMNTNATSGQESDESADEQRAKWERMSMTVLDGAGGGYVNVQNDSYGDDSGAHIYSVEVADGAAVGCSCPHAVHRGAHCKHQVAVENRPLVVSSASAAAASTPRVATDGGRAEGRR
jgi:hypothetical protein